MNYVCERHHFPSSSKIDTAANKMSELGEGGSTGIGE